jgi:hypothetical protein
LSIAGCGGGFVNATFVDEKIEYRLQVRRARVLAIAIVALSSTRHGK